MDKEITLISDTGIQLYTVPGQLELDLAAPVVRPLHFCEFTLGDTVSLDWVTYFQENDKYVGRGDLKLGGYIDYETGAVAPEEDINFSLLTALPQEEVTTIGRLNQVLGTRRRMALEMLEGRWLPVPMFESDTAAKEMNPTNWARILLRPVEEKCTPAKRVYEVVMAFDTHAVPEDGAESEKEAPCFDGQTAKRYSLCGYSAAEMEAMPPARRIQAENVDIPLTVYRYCDIEARPWLNAALSEYMECADPSALPEGSAMKHIAYYIYLVSVLHKLGAVPDVTLYNAAEQVPVSTNLVVDVGNSRTFGLLAEDPLDQSFSRSTVLSLRDLGTGRVWEEPFDMRLCFKEERFGLETASRQFQWPSILRLGREAERLIYAGSAASDDDEKCDTSHSSPKRYLWDTDPYTGQWKFITDRDRAAGPSHTVYVEGLMQQFTSDGAFTPDPAQMGAKASYSRSSLMTFAFIEILLQARMQANSYEFRFKAGEQSRPRRLRRVIVTCPTAMTAAEQLILRRCMADAAAAVSRFEKGTYEEPYDAEADPDRVEVIPSVRDLKAGGDRAAMRRSWSYDEATCCQMVYMYSELRRYMGDVRQFFSLYGRRRGAEEQESLTVGSLDIGAGTTDLMVCRYRREGEAVVPTPLFWESFHTAGSDLVRRIITDVLLEGPKEEHPGASGIITARLRDMGAADVAERMHRFFGETGNQGVVDRRMRQAFTVQVLIPVANRLLALLQKGEPRRQLTWDDLFDRGLRPGAELMDFFAERMGFRFEELTVVYDPEYLDEIVRRVFEISLRKWAAIFYTYGCDVVLLGGRPSSLGEIQRLMQRLMPVHPNRLISMNDYRVGSWYPGATDIGHFSDKKGLVAVGALIAYLAEQGTLPEFKLGAARLKELIKPTSEYIGVMNAAIGSMESSLTPEQNVATLPVSAFPVYLGARQIDVAGYPSRLVYRLDFDAARVREAAARQVAQKMGLPPDTPPEELPAATLANTADNVRLRARLNSPLQFTLERDYYADKEEVRIAGVSDAEGNPVGARLFALRLQTRTAGEADWLDSGAYTLRLGL